MVEPLEKKPEATIRDFLNVVFRRKYLIIVIVILTTFAVMYLNVRQPTVYESGSRILVKRGERANVFTGGVRYLGWGEEMSSQIEVILSEAVFARAREIMRDSLSARGLGEKAAFNRGAVRADVVGESNVFVIRYSDADPLVCRLGCAAVTESYKEYYRKKAAPPQLSDFFSKEITEVKTELEQWRNKKNAFLNEKGFFGLSEEGMFLLTKLTNHELTLSELKSELSLQKIKVEDLRALASLPPGELENRLSFSPSQNVLQSAILSNIKYQLQTMRVQREKLMNRYTEKHPDVLAVDNQISDLQLQLKKEVENYFNVEKSYMLQLIARMGSIEEEIKKIKLAMASIPDKEMELARIEHTIKLLEDRYELLLGKQNEAEIALASTPEWEITTLSPAGRAYPKKTKDYVRMALGPFFSFIVALGLAFFFESLDHSLKNVAEVEEYLGAPVLATVSELQEKG